MKDEPLRLGRLEFSSRFILGSGKYSPSLIQAAVEEAGTQIITLALRRANSGENILNFIPPHITLLPNTSGARTAEEALKIARLSRELGCGELIKVEVIADSKYLLPDNYESIRATELLSGEGFIPLVYMHADLYAARAMAAAGAGAIMPLGSPIGSMRGLAAGEFIKILIHEINLPIIVDAGLASPAQACEAMQLGAAAVMANTALATARDLPGMARAFGLAVRAGREAYLAGLGATPASSASPASPVSSASPPLASASSPLAGLLRDE